jgi:carbon-monoxide dehydrogenase medium subunit
MLTGVRIDPGLIRAAAETAGRETDPISDVRGSADYKRKMSVVFASRAITQALAQAEAQRDASRSGVAR